MSERKAKLYENINDHSLSESGFYSRESMFLRDLCSATSPRGKEQEKEKFATICRREKRKKRDDEEMSQQHTRGDSVVCRCRVISVYLTGVCTSVNIIIPHERSSGDGS